MTINATRPESKTKPWDIGLIFLKERIYKTLRGTAMRNGIKIWSIKLRAKTTKKRY